MTSGGGEQRQLFRTMSSTNSSPRYVQHQSTTEPFTPPRRGVFLTNSWELGPNSARYLDMHSCRESMERIKVSSHATASHGVVQFQHRILTAPVDGELVEGVVPPPDVSAFTRHRNKLQHFQHLINKGRPATAEDEATVEMFRDNLRQMLSEVQDRISHSTEHRTPSPTRLLRLARRCTSRDVEQPSEGSILELLPSPVPSKSVPPQMTRGFRLRSPPRPAPSMLKRSGSTGNLGVGMLEVEKLHAMLRERDKTIVALQRENAILKGGCPRCGEASKALSDCVISMRDVHSRVLKAISDLPSLLKEEESLIAKLSHFRKHRE